MEKTRVAVLFGGCSPEYGISLQSAAAVLENIDTAKYEPVMVGITREGDWYRYSGATARIAADSWQGAGCLPATILPSRTRGGLMLADGEGAHLLHIDAVLPVLHGQNGEDGTVQGLCELAGIPLAGCGTLASALCMDKHRAHQVAAANGIRVPAGREFGKNYDAAEMKKAAEALGYPLFVKPLRAGSSYGIARVDAPQDLQRAAAGAFRYDSRVIIEQLIDGVEVGCAVIGNDEVITGVPDEIELADGFFDFTEKYNLVTSKIHLPARVSAAKAAEIQAMAARIYRALGCRGFARVDMFLTPAGGLVFNEVNTIPGFTAHSRFPAMMRAAGYDFTAVISKIIDLALENAPKGGV